jgi:hypothetical protein
MGLHGLEQGYLYFTLLARQALQPHVTRYFGFVDMQAMLHILVNV